MCMINYLAELLLILRKFGKCNIKWPKNDGINHNMPGMILFYFIVLVHFSISKGFCHVVYREARSVCELLKHCTRQQRSTIDYFLHIHMSPILTTTMTTSGLSIRSDRLKPVCINTRFSAFVISFS
jgi:hypothetical protein